MKPDSKTIFAAATTLIIFVLLCYCASTAFAEHDRVKEPKTKWEHLALTHDGADVRRDELSVKIVKLGDKGWELVAVTPVVNEGSTDKIIFSFKRPKE